MGPFPRISESGVSTSSFILHPSSFIIHIRSYRRRHSFSVFSTFFSSSCFVVGVKVEEELCTLLGSSKSGEETEGESVFSGDKIGVLSPKRGISLS